MGAVAAFKKYHPVGWISQKKNRKKVKKKGAKELGKAWKKFTPLGIATSKLAKVKRCVRKCKKAKRRKRCRRKCLKKKKKLKKLKPLRRRRKSSNRRRKLLGERPVRRKTSERPEELVDEIEVDDETKDEVKLGQDLDALTSSTSE